MNRLSPPIARLLALQLLLIIPALLLMRVPLHTTSAFAFVFTFVTAMVGRKIHSPLQAILRKAKSPLLPLSKAELTNRDSEEWAELETLLDQIRGDLKEKTAILVREREELSTLMSAISEAILAVDQQGRLMFFNSRFAMLFIDRVERDIQNQQAHLGELFRTPSILQTFEKVLKSGISQQIDLPLFVKNNSLPRHFSLSVAPLRQEDGVVYGAIGVFYDVTELKRAEKIRIEFVANVSHELRTPLMAIKGYTDTLRQDIGRHDYSGAEKFLEVIARNSERLKRLIEDLLDLSSLETGETGDTGEAPSDLQATLHQGVDVRELTEKVLQQLEGRRLAKNQNIKTLFEATSVRGEPERIEQVLVNLIENAIKYTPAEGVIQIQWRQSPEEVSLHVVDNGPGIGAEHQPRLFERFYRVDQARSRELGGTGLGLAIVKHIMQRHGGSAQVVSELGQGTEFICRFPFLTKH